MDRERDVRAVGEARGEPEAERAEPEPAEGRPGFVCVQGATPVL